MKIVCALYDRKAEMYLDPFCVPTLAVAMRDVGADLNRSGENRLRDFREDFELWQLAVFDPESGFLEHMKPVKVCELHALYVGEASGSGDQLKLN